MNVSWFSYPWVPLIIKGASRFLQVKMQSKLSAQYKLCIKIIISPPWQTPTFLLGHCMWVRCPFPSTLGTPQMLKSMWPGLIQERYATCSLPSLSLPPRLYTWMKAWLEFQEPHCILHPPFFSVTALAALQHPLRKNYI